MQFRSFASATPVPARRPTRTRIRVIASSLTAVGALLLGCASDEPPPPDREVLMAVECEAPKGPPLMPDGATASRDEMLRARDAVNSFVAEAESYLTCLTERDLDMEEATEEEREALLAEHNRVVDLMEAVAAAFNTELRTFRERSN